MNDLDNSMDVDTTRFDDLKLIPDKIYQIKYK